MKIKLMILDRLAETRSGQMRPQDYFIREGHLDFWQYSPDVCQTKRIATVFA